MMPPELHRWFIATAAPLSPRLARAIEGAGPVWFPERPECAHGAPAFLARAIVGQQISAAAARGIWAKVEHAAAARGESLAAFLAAADAAALRRCGLSLSKTKAVRAVAAAQAAGLFDGLADLAHGARCEQLEAIWGVGPWTADMLGLFYYREPDIWPEGDLAVMRVFRSYIGRKKPERAALRFAPHRSLLALYMWKLVNAQM